MKKLYASLLSLSSFFLCSPLTSKADILSLEVLDSLSQRQKATSIRELREAQAAADAAAATISGLDNLPIYMDVDPGEISYQSGVSRSGAKTYSVPIFTAPSVGAKPTIALSYNSQSIQEGVAGVGWNIVGASAINLVNRTLYFDNDICAVDFSNPNTYALSLDGDRAISGTTLMGKVRITPKYNNDNVLISFDALMPDGEGQHLDCQIIRRPKLPIQFYLTPMHWGTVWIILIVCLGTYIFLLKSLTEGEQRTAILII